MRAVIERTFSSREVLALIPGLTYRQLDYWANTGLVGETNLGRGNHRLWTVAEVAKLQLTRTLLDSGVGLNAIRDAWDAGAIDYLLNRLVKSARQARALLGIVQASN